MAQSRSGAIANFARQVKNEKIFKFVILGLVAALIVIRFFPVDRSNPETKAEITGHDSAIVIFKAKCYVCHSNHTEWPLYSYVAPVSWLVASDVHEGREHLNFSDWKNYSASDKIHLAEEINEVIEEDEMPLKIYTIMNPDSKLSDKDKEFIYNWTEKTIKNLKAESSGKAKTESDTHEEDHHNHEH